MAKRDVFLLPITDENAIKRLKEILSTSSIDKKAIERSRKEMTEKYGLEPYIPDIFR